MVPGTNRATNRNAFDMIHRDTLFTNVALTADNEPWWEGRKLNTPVLDWQGKPYDAEQRRRLGASEFALHGVGEEQSYLLAAQRKIRRACRSRRIVFGGRRREVAPLVYEARNWQHGVLVGASVASETTAAATGAVGVVRRDPMAMKPFCRLQLRRLLAPLARGGQAPEEPAEALPRQLVPPRRGRQVPVAGLRRQPARHGVDPQALHAVPRGADESAIGYLPRAGDLNLKGVDVSPTPPCRNCSPWSLPPGARKPRRCANT